MSVIFILVIVAIIMAVAFLVAFIWAVKSGQYEDIYTPSVRILFDDPDMKGTENNSDQSQLTAKNKKTEIGDRRKESGKRK